jgi:hypothetical protein
LQAHLKVSPAETRPELLKELAKINICERWLYIMQLAITNADFRQIGMQAFLKAGKNVLIPKIERENFKYRISKFE